MNEQRDEMNKSKSLYLRQLALISETNWAKTMG